jgi:hypothetical protein
MRRCGVWKKRALLIFVSLSLTVNVKY